MRDGSKTRAKIVTEALRLFAEKGVAGTSVRDIAAAVSCSPVRLSRAFRRTFGVTMGQHQRRLRTARAAELLASTPVPIAEIAQICGFCDQPHLTRAFRAELGCTPAAFRRRA